MMRLIYSLAFSLGFTDWKLEETPVEIFETVNSVRKGHALDLGCGEGEHAVTLAKKGWQVTGVDFVRKAIENAKNAAEKSGVANKTEFLIGDVARLEKLKLTEFDFAFDIGCFHLLNKADQEAYITGVSNVLKRNAVLLLYAFTPRKQGRREVGFYPAELEGKFSEFFTLQKCEERTYWRFPANWYWFRRK
jgi:cyclopropane fatty-acyl-phospholipid synthase-like methyltransferase